VIRTPNHHQNQTTMAPPKAFYAIIAGVGSGTGRSLALRFAKAYPVVLLARSPSSYADIVSEIKQQGGEALGVSADTSDAAAIASAFETIRAEMEGGRGLGLAAAVCEYPGPTLSTYLLQSV
jgi:NAD(P)-dependent dehydrogenase (short-subunit alcohol dehydrogenase family)